MAELVVSSTNWTQCPNVEWVQHALAEYHNHSQWTVEQQLYWALQKIGANLSAPTSPADASYSERPSKLEVWGYGLLFVLLVSLSSIVGVLFLPLMKHESYKKVLMGMVGLAVGCLCGSAIFTLIPEAFGFNPDEEHEKYLYKACVVVGAIYAFFLTERLLKLFVDHRKRTKELQRAHSPNRQHHQHHESQLNAVQFSALEHKHENGHGETQMSEDSFDEAHHAQNSCGGLHTKIPPAEVRTHAHEHAMDSKELHDHPIKTVAWMVITGDGIVDGLSMGAAFNESILKGLSISLAVLCEELPHELGDLAILLNSGMSLKRALMYNFLSACTCFAGLIVGILLSSDPTLPDASAWIFAIAGGMFLYISLVDMLPEMTHSAEEASGESTRNGLVMLVIQNVGMISGFVLMFVLARFKKNMAIEPG